jgi:hypothetical protein
MAAENPDKGKGDLGVTIEKRLAEVLPGALDFARRAENVELGALSRFLNRPLTRPDETLMTAFARAIASQGFPPEEAQAALKGLRLGRPVLAANHHGLETHPEMVQGTLIFGLAAMAEALATQTPTQASDSGDPPPPTIVLAASGVPLNNQTAPGGIMVGRRGESGRRLQLRLFSRSQDHVLAGRAPALTQKSLFLALDRLARAPLWFECEKRTAASFLETYPLDRTILELPDFLTQASKIAARVWADRLKSAGLGPKVPPLIHLELEALVSACLAQDMADPLNPISRVLFKSPTRAAVLRALAGRAGAWSAALIGPAAKGSRPKAQPKADPTGGLSDVPPEESGGGTVFFWGVDKRGERRRLKFVLSGDQPYLAGPAESIPLAPEPIATALAEGRLIPGLFLDYLTLAVHGLTTYGGVFMIDYLPALLGSVAEILGIKFPGFDPKEDRPDSAGKARGAGVGEGRRTGGLIPGYWPPLAAGILPLGREEASSPSGFSAIGALELFALGPFSALDLTRLAAVTVGQAWPFTAGEWYQEETPPKLREPFWEKSLGPPALIL